MQKTAKKSHLTWNDPIVFNVYTCECFCWKEMETEEGTGSRLLEKADPGKQESLMSEVVPDPMEGEQTWPTEEELTQGQWGNKHGVVSLWRGNKHVRQRKSSPKVSGGTNMVL